MPDANGQTLNRKQLLDELRHAVNSPLGSIFIRSEIILNGEEGEVIEPVRKGIEQISTEAHHLSDVFNSVFTLVQWQTAEISSEKVDIKRLFEDVRREILTGAQAAQHKVELHSPAELVTVQTDFKALRQFVLNALSYMLQISGQDTIGIWLSIDSENATVRIVEGQSEPQVTQAEIAELPRKYVRGPLGVQLLACSLLMEKLGGSLWIDGSPASGITFCFELPVDHRGGR